MNDGAPVALVFGAAGAIGSATAVALAERGHRVMLADKAPLEDVITQLPGSGHEALAVDLLDDRSIEAVVKAAWGGNGLDAVVLATGVNYTGAVADTSWPDYDRVMAVNLRAAFKLGQVLAGLLRERPRPVGIVLLSSVAGLHGEPGGAVYCASKAGLIALVQSLAAEIAAGGARVNAVCPGNVDSPMLRALAQQVADREQQSFHQVLAQFAAASAFHRLITPQEVARACSWLASGEASGISGQVVVVDGPPPG